MSKRMVVIGAGPGGLAAAMLLASKGHEVHVYEKQPYIGGRNSEIRLGDYKFDMGPTFLQMVYILEEVFQAAKRNLHDYVKIVELKDMYELIYPDKTFTMTRDKERMAEQIEKLFPGNGDGYERFMRDSGKKMEALAPVLQAKMNRLMDLFNPKVLKALPELEVTKTLIGVLSKYFKEEDLQLAFAFQAKYLGMSPWECPGAFSILSYMEHAYGVYHVEGGLNRLSHAMAEVVKEYGGQIHVNAGVKKLWLDGKTVKGVYLEDGERVAADEVIINSDFGHAMTHLVDDGVLKKYTPEKLEKKKYSCSTFMLYLGLNKRFDDMPHHTIVFADDYKKNVEEISKTKLLSEDPSIYIQNATVTDPTLAPEGKSTLYILAPVPNNFSSIDWEEQQQAFRRLILDIIEEKTGFKNIEQYIEEERMITPENWEKEIYVYKGATFNLGHQLSQMMVFRPHNKFEELKNCWLVGGGTHPGSGLPTIIESARISVNGILEQYGEKAVPVRPLPVLQG